MKLETLTKHPLTMSIPQEAGKDPSVQQLTFEFNGMNPKNLTRHNHQEGSKINESKGKDISKPWCDTPKLKLKGV